MTEPVKLSPRMEEVVILVAKRGLTYPEVAGELGISPSTVKKYAERIGRRIRQEPRKAMFWYYREVILSNEDAA